MKALENRTLDSKQEMDIMAALDEMKSMRVCSWPLMFDYYSLFKHKLALGFILCNSEQRKFLDMQAYCYLNPLLITS